MRFHSGTVFGRDRGLVSLDSYIGSIPIAGTSTEDSFRLRSSTFWISSLMTYLARHTTFNTRFEAAVLHTRVSLNREGYRSKLVVFHN